MHVLLEESGILGMSQGDERHPRHESLRSVLSTRFAEFGLIGTAFGFWWETHGILERRTMVPRRALDRGIHPSPLLWLLREELKHKGLGGIHPTNFEAFLVDSTALAKAIESPWLDGVSCL